MIMVYQRITPTLNPSIAFPVRSSCRVWTTTENMVMLAFSDGKMSPTHYLDIFVCAGGVIREAGPTCPVGTNYRHCGPGSVFRTHDADADPVVATFDNFLSPTEAARYALS